MPKIFRPAGRAQYVLVYTDPISHKRRKKTFSTDKQVSQQAARKFLAELDQRKLGLVDSKAEAYRDHEAKPLAEHIGDWQANLLAQGSGAGHAESTSNRARWLLAVMFGCSAALVDHRGLSEDEQAEQAQSIAGVIAKARLTDLVREKAQEALSRLQATGWSLQSCNGYRGSITSFSKWCWDSHRTREHSLRGLRAYNAKEDPRHPRRAISIEDLRRLIEVTEKGRVVAKVKGPVRALCYRLAVATGLRISEIASITTRSFDWSTTPATVTVGAGYTKNGQTATQPLPNDLVDDLAAFVATIPAGEQVFKIPRRCGARMLRTDLEAAGIPYQDASGQFFDFHALRGMTATLADAAGVSPRVVQRIMRHSSLELTDRYTRSRAVDIEAAASMLPSLKPAGDRPESATLAATGTDPRPVLDPRATQNRTRDNGLDHNPNATNGVTLNVQRIAAPLHQHPLSVDRIIVGIHGSTARGHSSTRASGGRRTWWS